MPVTEQTTVNTHNGNGVTTVFAYSFKILDQADIEVRVDGVVKTLTTDYTVSGVGNDGGGSVTMLAIPASGTENVVLRRAMAYERSNDYQENGDLDAATLDEDADRPIMMVQQLKAELTRSIKLPVGTTTDQEIAESAADRAGGVLGFDGDGNLVLMFASDLDVSLVSSFMSTLLDDANAAAARATLGAWGGASADIASAATLDLTGASGIARITGTTATTDITINAGQRVECVAAAAWPLTYHATNVPLPGGVSYTCAAGDVVVVSKDNNGAKHIAITKADGTPVVASSSMPRGYIDGFIMSTAGSSATMTIGAGQATDSTGAVLMSRAASMAKTTSAWAAGTGNGGLDTGSIANATWYHFFEIRKADGTEDVVFSTSASAPTMPSGYTYKRRLGSGLTNGSAQWVLFQQDGDEFTWDVPVLDVNATNPGTSAVTRTLSVPAGVRVLAKMNASWRNATSTDAGVLLSELAVTDTAPSITAAPLMTMGMNGTSGWSSYIQAATRTNTSSQIRSRASASGASDILRIATTGWVDSRGRNA